MSGGAYDYAFHKVEQMASDMRQLAGVDEDPLRRSFADHLDKVAEAMRAVEWVDSGDRAPGGERAEIRAVLEHGALCHSVDAE